MAEVGNLFFINSRFTEFQDGFLVMFLLALMMVVSGDSDECLVKAMSGKVSFLTFLFSYDTSMIFLIMMFLILPFVSMIVLPTLSVVGCLACDNSLRCLLTLNLNYEAL